jgi:hypothetical protein
MYNLFLKLFFFLSINDKYYFMYDTVRSVTLKQSNIDLFHQSRYIAIGRMRGSLISFVNKAPDKLIKTFKTNRSDCCILIIKNDCLFTSYFALFFLIIL